MRINYNASAVVTNKTLNRNDELMSQSMERLSSGFKINYAKDNPAGLAIANRMNAQIKGLGISGRNTNDGISVVETADGALTEVTAILQRMNELAVKSGTDTLTDGDREMIQAEIEQLQKELKLRNGFVREETVSAKDMIAKDISDALSGGSTTGYGYPRKKND